MQDDLSPSQLAERLIDLSNEVYSAELGERLTQARRALEAVQAEWDKAGERQLRILRAKSVEEAEAILDEINAPPPPPKPQAKQKPAPAKKKKPAAKKAAAKAGPLNLREMRCETWGQYCTVLRSLDDGVSLDERGEFDDPDVAFFHGHFKAGHTVGHALDEWHKRPERFASVAALSHPQTPMDHPSDEPLVPSVGQVMADQAALYDDPNVNGRGEYVEGVREVVVSAYRGGNPGVPGITLRVARGADGMYRTGYLLAFANFECRLEMDADVPVRVDANPFEVEAYALKTRAQTLAHHIRHNDGQTWSDAQKPSFRRAVADLERFIEEQQARKAG